MGGGGLDHFGLGCGKVAKVKGKLHPLTGHEGPNWE